MKRFKIIPFLPLLFIMTTSCSQNTSKTSLYDIQINSLFGDSIDLKQYKGKKILFVNVASKCGFTPQYKGLQGLYDTYKDQLVIIGVPCNQFKNQEPGTAKDIAQFCKANYGVTFPITEKADVKGETINTLCING